MKISLPIKLGIFVILLFAAVITTCLLWTPIKMRRVRSKLRSADMKQKLAAVDDLLKTGEKGINVLAGEFKGGEEEARFLAKHWKNYNGMYEEKGMPLRPLHMAIWEGFNNAAILLIEKGADVNIRTFVLPPPLHMAVGKDNIEITAILIDKGANVNSYTMPGMQRPIHMAIKEGSTRIARLLIESGADINLQDNDGMTPLHTAIRNFNPDIALLLVEKGADVNVLTRESKTSLNLCIEFLNLPLLSNQPSIIKKKYERLRKVLLECGAKTGAIMTDEGLLAESGYIRENRKSTDLHDAVLNGDIDFVRSAIKKGVNLNAGDSDNQTPLHNAAYRGYRKIAGLLIENGADVNAKDNFGMIPLHLATFKGNRKTMILLIDKGANINEKGKNGATPLHDAISSLVNMDIITLLIDKGANISETNDYGWTPLYEAVCRGYTEAATLLLKKGADVNARSSIYNNTPLHLTSDKNMAAFLIENGALVNGLDKNGKTPLDRAIARSKDGKNYVGGNNEGVIEVLRANGGKTGEELKNKTGQNK